MKTKFNNSLKQNNKLFKLASKALKAKYHLLPILPSLKSNLENSKLKTKKVKKYMIITRYKAILNNEIEILKAIKFDGYLYIIYEIIQFAKQSNITLNCYGSIQNSLISYLLDIVDTYTLKNKKDFINFIPFEKKPTLNIIISSNRYHEIISFIKYKYPSLIKKVKNKIVIFNDNLKIKLIDLNIEKQIILKNDDVKNLGLKIIKPNINISQKKAIFIKVQNKKLKNAWLKKRKIDLLLGLESLNIGDVLINKILMARDKDNYKPFTSIDNFKIRVPMINDTDKKTQKLVFENLQIDLNKMNRLKIELKNYKKNTEIKNINN